MRLLILGGTGPSGRALIRHLRGECTSTKITVISRTTRELPGAARVLTGRYVDILRSAEFAGDLGTFDAVLHLGDGLGTLQANVREDHRIEADRLIASSESVAIAARDARVPCFIYVSSIKALCDEEDERILVETSEPRSTSLYGRSKLRLERAIGAALEGSATRHVILRNPLVYSEDRASSIHRLIGLADTPLPLPFGGLTNRRSLLAAGNFAGAMAAVVRAGRNGASGTFHVHDGPPLSTTEIVATVRAALGRPLRLFAVGAAAARITRHTPLLAPAARRLYGSLELSDARFRQSFGWAPTIGTKAALTELVAQTRAR